MNAMQLDVLERVAVDQLAAHIVGSRDVVMSAPRTCVAETDTSAVRRLVELGLVDDDADPNGRPRIRVTPAGVEALAYLASVA
ncbi:hypothetical protein [Gordonia sp. YY1]|uniref:hypothetical protein n=1 Tax=Gordonia sp. YY1 TaxID=396712 RepID=UPI0013317DC5|nr:hypothetical protein [Gordonia sp. YY1]KAF0968356.1 hypothetical protein BPODLACK_03018 [Gordonia sp. YY1]